MLRVSADFPFRLGMNYRLQYSERYDLLILVASRKDNLPTVLVFSPVINQVGQIPWHMA